MDDCPAGDGGEGVGEGLVVDFQVLEVGVDGGAVVVDFVQVLDEKVALAA